MRLRLVLTAAALLLAATPAVAAGLSGMGANIFGNYFNFAKANLPDHPVTRISAGKLAITLQRTRLRDLQKAFGGTIQTGGGATWLCYHTGDAASWFISNALGGQEFVMMVALEATSRKPAECEAPNAAFATPGLNVPGLGGKAADIKAALGVAASGSTLAFRADKPGGYTDKAQYLGYVLKSGVVTGLGVGETSIPTAH
jgi:hypothetical protein